MAPETKEDYYGRNFLSELSKLNEATRNSYLRKVNEVLKCAVPQLDNLSFVKDENGFYHWKPSIYIGELKEVSRLKHSSRMVHCD